MFNEAYRILKKDGIFRITTPNISLDLDAWRKNDSSYFYWIEFYSNPKVCKHLDIKPFNQASLGQVMLFNFASHVSQVSGHTGPRKVSDEEIFQKFSELSDEDALNYFTDLCTIEAQTKKPGYHMNWWTYEKAEKFLREAGFKNIYKSEYGQSRCPAMRDLNLFDKQDPKISLYIEAVK